jgi:hypothetical protein
VAAGGGEKRSRSTHTPHIHRAWSIDHQHQHQQKRCPSFP